MAKDINTEDRMLLRVEELCVMLSFSRAQIYQFIKDGEIPSIKIGRSRRIPVEQLKRWLAKKTANKTV